MGDDARFFLTAKDGACTLGINAEGDPYHRLPKHVGVGLGGNSLPPRKDAHRREGVPPLRPLADRGNRWIAQRENCSQPRQG